MIRMCVGSGINKQIAVRAMPLVCAVSLYSLAVGSLVSPVFTPAVQAYTTEDVLNVSWETGEDYNALVRRAESAARASAQQQFDSDILLTRVIITVLGENGGETVPILMLDVNRNDWRRRPDPQYWATYYRTSRTLLNLDKPAARTAQPAPASPSAPASTGTFSVTPANNSDAPNRSGTTDASPRPAGSESIDLVPLSMPATPAGQTGLPRSILR